MGTDAGTTFILFIVMLVIVVSVMAYTLRRDKRPPARTQTRANAEPTATPTVKPRADTEQVKKRTRTVDPDRIHDLRHLDSIRLRIRGSFGSVTDAERKRYGGREYLLIREPDNAHDSNAVAVYGGDRRVGYVTAARASSIAPLLDLLDADAFRVTGAGVDSTSIRLWVNVPKVPALREHVKHATR